MIPGVFSFCRKKPEFPLDKEGCVLYCIYSIYTMNINKHTELSLPRPRRGAAGVLKGAKHGHHIKQLQRKTHLSADRRPVKEQVCSGSDAGGARPLCACWPRSCASRSSPPSGPMRSWSGIGFLENVPGKGCFVAPQNRELLREAQLRRAEEFLAQAVEEARKGRHHIRGTGRNACHLV